MAGTARDLKTTADLQALGQAYPGRLDILELDVCEADSSLRAAEKLSQSLPAIDVLINNAAIFPKEHDTLDRLETTEMLKTFHTNAVGPMLVTRGFLPLLLKGQSSAIVNVSSRAGCVSQPLDDLFYTYGASKAALNRLTRDLARELKPLGICVVAISPGWVRTAMGGPDGTLSVEESAVATSDLLEKLSPTDSGLFLDPRSDQSCYPW